MSYQSNPIYVNKSPQVFKQKYGAWGRLFEGYRVRLSDIQKHLGLLKDLNPKDGYLCWVFIDCIVVTPAKNKYKTIKVENITPKQFRTIKRYKLKAYTLID